MQVVEPFALGVQAVQVVEVVEVEVQEPHPPLEVQAVEQAIEGFPLEERAVDVELEVEVVEVVARALEPETVPV